MMLHNEEQTEVASVDESAQQPLLLDAKQVATLLRISKNMIWKLHSAGKLPTPVRLGRCVRWRRDEIVSWVARGCPPLRNGTGIMFRGRKLTSPHISNFIVGLFHRH